MKNIFNYRLIIALIIIIVSFFLIIVSTFKIQLDPSIQSLFPDDKKMERTLALSSLSQGADKVILYIEVNDQNQLENAVNQIDEIIDDSPIKFKNSIPEFNDIKQLMEYTEKYSLLLYPYEKKENPFIKEQIVKKLKKKIEYLTSLAFFSVSDSFFLDPLMMGTELLKDANLINRGIYTPKFGGVVSKNNKSYIKILKSGFYSEDYEQIKDLKELDNKLEKYSKEVNCKAFLFSSHLFYLESKKTVIQDIYLIFILSTIIILFVFYYFFRKITLLFFSFLPIIAGLALTFLLIAVFKKTYGGVALAFGATTSGIAVDYIVHYLTKKDIYINLSEVRKKIGFSLLLGFITTIASFVFLPFSRILSLQEIALFGILAISFSFFISWFLLQRLLPPGEFEIKLRRINFPVRVKGGLIIWIIIIVFFIIFIPFIKFEDNIHDLDMKHKVLKERLNIIQQNFKESTDSIFLAFSGNDRDEILEKSYNALNILQNENNDLTFFTPAIFYPPESKINERKDFIKNNFNKDIFLNILAESNFEKNTFNNWLNIIDNINSFSINDIPEYYKQEFDSMFVEWNNKKFILIPLYKQDIAQKAKEILNKNNIDFFIIDIVKDSASGLISFETKALGLLLLSMIIIFIILLIAYKKLIFAFSAILPSICALISCFAITVITKHDFNIMHFVSCVLLLGTGVDYGIFITNAFKDNYSDEEIKLTYQSIFICVLTTIAGFGVLALSRNYSIFSLGSSMFIGIITAFLTAYLVLPYLNKKR